MKPIPREKLRNFQQKHHFNINAITFAIQCGQTQWVLRTVPVRLSICQELSSCHNTNKTEKLGSVDGGSGCEYNHRTSLVVIRYDTNLFPCESSI